MSNEEQAIARKLLAFPDRKVLIAPSLLAADFARLGEEVAAVEKAGAEVLHLDVMDGHFVPNLTFGPDVVKAVRRHCGMLLDTHLMIEHPATYVPVFAKAGTDHITFHVESADDPATVLSLIHEQGCTAGISVKPRTPAEAILPYLSQVEMVLVMTVEPGFGGQSFMADMLPKIAQLRQALDKAGSRARLEVDGGIAKDTAALVREAGADTLVAGSSVFRAPNGAYRSAIDVLR